MYHVVMNSCTGNSFSLPQPSSCASMMLILLCERILKCRVCKMFTSVERMLKNTEVLVCMQLCNLVVSFSQNFIFNFASFATSSGRAVAERWHICSRVCPINYN